MTEKLLRACALTALTAVSFAPVLMACGSSTPASTTPNGAPSAAYVGQPTAPAGYPAATPATAYPTQPGVAPATPGAPATATPGAAPLASVNTTDPNSLQALIAQAQAAGAAMVQQPGGGGAAGGGGGLDPIALGLKAVAAKDAPGMTAGQIFEGNVAAGGHLQGSFSMQPGTCYTIVGFAIPGTVTNLDLNLFAPPLYNVLAGQDTTDNNTPVIGAKPMCPAIPFALTYKLDMTARVGQGQVGAQIYSKPQK